jgi:hypothetical protein
MARNAAAAAGRQRLGGGAWILALALLLAGAFPAIAAEPPSLVKARSLYNAGNFEGAIDAAAVARREPQFADAAALVIARSHLERYRQRADPTELTSAREALGSVNAAALGGRDQVDLLVGMGQWLYLGEIFGAAAELFETALNRSELLMPADRTMLLDWWATALDHEAQGKGSEERERVFRRIAERMETALWQEPGNAPANYWLATAARGTGDLDRAWSASIAAWVRSSLSPTTAASLRADLDRLVTQAIIPERVRSRPAADRPEAINALRMEWELVKTQWP